MKARRHDPLRLDVERFAIDAGRIEGHWPLDGMRRLVDACCHEEVRVASEPVRWQAVGERRRDGRAGWHAWLQLRLDTQVKLNCQRCLGPVETTLHVERWFHFVAGEEQAERLDAECEEDVLASTRSLDLRQLAEDELLLALPLVPRHEVCPQPLLPAAAEGHFESEVPHAFAALAAVRRAH